MLGALGQVDVLTSVLALRGGVIDASTALSTAVPALLVGLCRRSGRRGPRETLLWDVRFTRLFDALGERTLEFSPPAQGVLADPSGVEIRSASGARFDALGLSAALPEDVVARQRFHAVTPGGPVLALSDSNPLFDLEEHPDKQGNAVDLGGRSPEQWCDRLSAAFTLIEQTLPDLHAELLAGVERVIPVGYDPERHLSASYREAPGLVYLTLHPSELTMTEALIHEAQHGKLNALRWFDPLLDNGDSTWSRSPVRPDLRPLAGVLLAVHAFVPVAALHRRLEELGHPLAAGPEFSRRRREVHGANEHGLATLRELGRPTALGRRVLAALEALHAATRTESAPVDPAASVTALG